MIVRQIVPQPAICLFVQTDVGLSMLNTDLWYDLLTASSLKKVN